MAHYSSPALLFLFFSLCGLSLTNSLRNGFSVELIHRDSPKSPIYRPLETDFLRVSNAVRRSFNRANRFNKDCTHTKEPESYIAIDEFDYIMRYSVGTPPFQIYGVVDTGSDLIWLQCQPCKLCYNQSTPIFDPSKSKTYKILPCSSRTCKQGGAFTYSCSSNNNCLYDLIYESGDESSGDLSLETLTLESTSGSLVSFPRTVIGCGNHNNSTMAGIVGLGGGPFSLIRQLGSSIKGKFSYCLVPMFSRSNTNNTSSRLNFGDAAVVLGHEVVSTPLTIIDGSLYTLTLKAFSVGSNRVDFVDSSSNPYAKKIIIDSGSTLTTLPDDFYNKLESSLEHVVKLKRAEDPYKQFSLCYEGVLDSSKVPIIIAHFEGADVRLNAINTFVQVTDRVFCFTFTTSKKIHIGIFGNLAQQNFLIGYDLEKKILSFKPTDCANQVV